MCTELKAVYQTTYAEDTQKSISDDTGLPRQRYVVLHHTLIHGFGHTIQKHVWIGASFFSVLHQQKALKVYVDQLLWQLYSVVVLLLFGCTYFVALHFTQDYSSKQHGSCHLPPHTSPTNC